MWVDFEAPTNYRVDLIGGYRFFRVDDSVTIDDSTSTIGGLLAQTTFTANDRFVANNQFHGGEIGMSGQFYFGRGSLEAIAKIGLGNVHEVMRISGYSTVTTLGTTSTTVGGLLAQPTNIGKYSRNEFAVLPETSLNYRFDLTCHWRLNVGYSFMYLNRVQHSGTAIDTTVNPTQIGGTLTGPARPAFAFQDTGFFVQGITTGLEYRW